MIKDVKKAPLSEMIRRWQWEIAKRIYGEKKIEVKYIEPDRIRVCEHGNETGKKGGERLYCDECDYEADMWEEYLVS